MLLGRLCVQAFSAFFVWACCSTLSERPLTRRFLSGLTFCLAVLLSVSYLWRLTPVTAAQTETGKWIYGFLIGIVAILVRVVNPAFPEGVMLAILLMNVCAPLIDHIVIRQNVKRRLSRVKNK